MTFTEAAAHVLRLAGKPLHYKEITDVAIEKNLLSHVGKSPEVTMGARLAAIVQKGEKDSDLVRVKPGVFALREWDAATVKKGLADRTPALERIAKNGGGEAEAEEAEAESAPASGNGSAEAYSPPDDDDDGSEESIADDEKERAEMVAGASDVFEAEEDDDELIFGAEEEPAERAERGEGSGRRRRRRRRRGGRSAADSSAAGGGGLPSYTVSEAPADDGNGAPSPSDGNGAPLDELAGSELADAVVQLLGRRSGLTGFRQIADAAQRAGRLTGDTQSVQSLVASAIRADNLRRSARGERPRFRVTGGRVGLTDALLDDETMQLERQAHAAIERYREAARRALLKRLQELPTRAFGELVMLVLERLGMTRLCIVKRPGAHGAELHLSAVAQGPAGDVKTAVVVRRDGREIGRERVTELRGALHHYDGASAACIVTAGQVLSGAREEASVSGAAPVTLIDGIALAKLCDEHGVAVLQTQVTLPVPDVELLDALRSG